MAARSEVTPGTVFGRDFEVIDFLAAGGMGTVYVALQLSTGKKRAVKVMHGRHEGDDRTRKRFAQEARAGAGIESDHMVETLGAGVDDDTGLPWIAMELLTGQDLKEVSEKRGALPRTEVLEIFRQMCHALAEAHRQGVVHRDLKPENIFLANARREGVPFTIKILDFGIAKLVAEATAASSQTQAVGSPRWMAPEQADRGGDICPATDVWAMGLIAFQLLTGKCYWMTAHSASPTVMAQVCEILMEGLENASARAARLGVGNKIPAGFDAWFSRCVVRDIDARYPNAAEAMIALAPILSDPSEAGPYTRSIMPSAPAAPISARTTLAPNTSGTFASLPPPSNMVDLSLPVAPGAELGSLSDRLPDSLVSQADTPTRPTSMYIVGGLVALVILGGGAVAAFTHHPNVSPEITAHNPPAHAPPVVTPPPVPPQPATPAADPVPQPAVVAPTSDVPTVALPATPTPPVVAETTPVTDPHARGAHGRGPAAPGAAPETEVDPTPAPTQDGEGFLDRGRVHELLSEHTTDMETCYEHGTVDHPNVSGRLVLTFTLGGSPHPVAVATTGLEGAPAVGQCIQALVRGLSFPMAAGGTAFFSFPLRFSRGDSTPAATPSGGGTPPSEAPAPAPTPAPAPAEAPGPS